MTHEVCISMNDHHDCASPFAQRHHGTSNRTRSEPILCSTDSASSNWWVAIGRDSRRTSWSKVGLPFVLQTQGHQTLNLRQMRLNFLGLRVAMTHTTGKLVEVFLSLLGRVFALTKKTTLHHIVRWGESPTLGWPVPSQGTRPAKRSATDCKTKSEVTSLCIFPPPLVVRALGGSCLCVQIVSPTGAHRPHPF